MSVTGYIADFMEGSWFFGASVCLVAYAIGLAARKRFRGPLFNPLLIADAVVIIFILATGTDPHDFSVNADLLTFFITPATVCLAIPLYDQIKILKHNRRAILAGITAGVAANVIFALAYAAVAGFSRTIYVTILPKSITTAIGIGVSEELGGIPALTVALIIVTGNIGYILADRVCRIFRITDPVAVGLAIGTSSHVLGTAHAIELGEVQGAISSLSIVIAGIITVIVAPIAASFL